MFNYDNFYEDSSDISSFDSDVAIDWGSGSVQSLGGSVSVPTEDGSVSGSLGSLFSNMMQTALGAVGLYSKVKSTPTASQQIAANLASQKTKTTSYMIIAVAIIGVVLLFGIKK
jgi:hypothetical protein